MNYQTIEPGIDLRAFIKCYWTLDALPEENSGRQRIVPDGCMEMIFHCGDLYNQHLPDGTVINQPRCFVFGQITHPLDIEATGTTGIFAIRFQPDGFAPFATLPVADMENRAVSLEVLFGREGLLLEQKVLGATTNEQRVAVAEDFLMNRLINPQVRDRLVKSSVEMIFGLNGHLTVDALTEQLQVNRRQLERKFSSAVGLSPKQLSKIIRLQAALKILAGNQATSLTAVAHEGNYYDQAHFIRDFKEFTGISPKNFYASNLKMSSLFIDTE